MPGRVADTSLAEFWSARMVPTITTDGQVRRLLRDHAPEQWMRDAAADQGSRVEVIGATPLPLHDRQIQTIEVRIGTPPLACTAHLWVDDQQAWRCSVFVTRSDMGLD